MSCGRLIITIARWRRVFSRLAAASFILLLGCVFGAAPTLADEGGVSFWIPGLFGSLAATPQQPGFSFSNIYYHTSVQAGADVAFARQVVRGNLTTNFNGNLNARLNAQADLNIAIPSYVFADPILGGQASLALLVPYGRSQTDVNATLTGALGPLGFAVSGGRSDEVTGFGDLVPQFAMRWNSGVNNYMTYVTGNLTVGRYDATSLANLGIGHNAIDAGGGYTYFDPKTGYEASAVLGFTYNFLNEHTQYQNGVDMHLDWGFSRFVTKEWQVGWVGYVYRQLSCDSGSGDRVGCFESQVFGIGPQVGRIIPLGDNLQGYLNLKAYREFASEHRPDGWNVWLTFVLSPAAEHEASPKRSALITK